MKKIILFFFLIFNSHFVNIKSNIFPDINCSSYVVMNAKTKEVLAGKNINLKRSVASISKIMTAILALESGEIFDMVTIEDKDTKMEGSSIYLKLGDKISILDLTYGLLLRSGNDAASAISRHIEKNDNFALKMNEKAQELNLSDSTFNNPSGLDIDDEGNISTSFDIASLYSYCLENNLFKAIVSTKNYSINNVSWRNKNKLLHRYQYCTGGKTGYTYKAKRTLVTSAKKEDFELVIVTLNCGNDFSIHESLYEYFFNNYYYINFLEKGINYINDKIIKSEKNIGLTIEKNKLDDNTYKIYRFDNNNNLLECQLRKNNEILWSRFLNE